ncbi:MAG TPA: hypothetical protein VF054_04915 [Micromonosporaceae bacterium]
MAQVPDDVVARLYTVPPERFVAERNDAVAAARRSGDRERAAAIGALRKPTVAAWLVNLLVWRRPDLVDDLLRLGDELRAAQRDLRGERLRELSARRRGMVGDLAAQARELAVAAGRSARDDLPLAEVEETLTAALVDAGIADEVRDGRLTKALSYAGFGEPPRPRLRLVEPPPEQPEKGGARGPHGKATKGAERRGTKPAGKAAKSAKGVASKASEQRAERERREARRRADRELKAAQTEARRIEAELARATEAEQQASRKLRKILDDLADLQRRRDAADAAVTSAKLARKSAERAAARAARRLEAAADAADAARG